MFWRLGFDADRKEGKIGEEARVRIGKEKARRRFWVGGGTHAITWSEKRESAQTDAEGEEEEGGRARKEENTLEKIEPRRSFRKRGI